MPVAVAHLSPAEMRRVAWALVMGELKELDEGKPMPPEEGAMLCSQVDGPLDLAMLAWSLLDLSVLLWAGQHPDLPAARRSAAEIALQLAEQ